MDTWRPLEGPSRPRLEALFGPDGATKPVIVHVSNFRPVKRVGAVVEVFERVVAEHDALLLLIGEGPDRAGVERSLRERRLMSRTVLLDNQDRVEDLLRECAVFLLPSQTESFGLAALEALASGVPVVASAVGGLPEVIVDGRTGYLVAADDVVGMAARVGSLLAPALRREMGTAARADVVARFRAAPMVDRYEALYASVLAGR